MDNLPADWLSLLILTFVLGMKHGFDADHLATIDGLTRFNAKHHPKLARSCGSLFSLGHGAVVILIALSVSILAKQWVVPEWFEMLGNLISISFLILLGTLNLTAVLGTAPNQIVKPIGIKGKIFGKLQNVSHPALIALVGAFFALSFDTLSQAAFFALTASRYGGWEHALLFASLFMAGMLLTDGINGLWISRLIARTDQVALIASRVMGLVVSGISLLVAAFGAAKLLSPAVDTWSEGKEMLMGGLLISLILFSFFLALHLARPDENHPIRSVK